MGLAKVNRAFPLISPVRDRDIMRQFTLWATQDAVPIIVRFSIDKTVLESLLVYEQVADSAVSIVSINT